MSNEQFPGTLTRYEQKVVDGYTYPLLIVCKGKHGTGYYIAQSQEGFWKLCLEILTDYKKAGWYYKPDPPKPFALTDEQIAALPEHYKEDAEYKRNRHQEEMRQYEDDRDFYEAMLKAIQTKDGKLAWQLLRFRKDYEYEGFEVEQVGVYK